MCDGNPLASECMRNVLCKTAQEKSPGMGQGGSFVLCTASENTGAASSGSASSGTGLVRTEGVVQVSNRYGALSE